MRTLIAPLTFFLALALPQEPKVQEPPSPKHAGFAGSDVEAARFRTEILGAWQLTRGEIPDLGASSGGVAGYALFMEGYMSLEVHVRSNLDTGEGEAYFQTGTHRWKIEDNGTLESYGLIGTHNSSDDNVAEFEPPGERREYKVKLDGDKLVLERADRTSRFTFMRLGKLRYPDGKDGPTVDFYGRPIKPKPEGEKPKEKGG